jgi:hypothetical protein
MKPYFHEEVKAKLESHSSSEVSTIPVTLNSELVSSLRNRLPRDKRDTAYVLLDIRAYNAFVHDDDLLLLFDPVPYHEAVIAGHFGTLMGMDMFTDGIYNPDQRILPAHRIYIMAADGSEGYGSAVKP